MSNGVLIGRFMPPHEGHTFLLDFARRYVEKLVVLISCTPGDPIAKSQRLEWAQELFGDCEIVTVDASVEDAPAVWARLIKSLDAPVEYLFSCDSLGKPLARELSLHLVTLEPSMLSIELESDAIRRNPAAHWDRLPGAIRQKFLKRVCAFGPESTGKSTLCHMLATHFQTLNVPEYSRAYLESKEGEYEYDDVVPVARGQRAWEYAYSRRARRVLFCDTDMLTTKIWSDWLFKKTDPWVEERVESERHDLYLLTAADVPWVEDQVRYLPNDRENFEARCEEELIRHGRRYVKLSGDWENRFETAVRAVDALLEEVTSGWGKV